MVELVDHLAYVRLVSVCVCVCVCVCVFVVGNRKSNVNFLFIVYW